MKIVEKLIGIVIAVYIIADALPGALSALGGAALAGVPSNLSSLFVNLITLIVILGVVYLVWEDIKPTGGA